MSSERSDSMRFESTLGVGRRVLLSEAAGLRAQALALDQCFPQAVEKLSRVGGRIVCTGIGKSGHVARKVAATFASTGSPSIFVHPAEASHGDLGMVGIQDIILALSRSGEARELADILGYAKRFDIPVIAITSSPKSALGNAADVVLKLADVPEATAEVQAPTTSTTLQMAMGDALAVALLERRGFSARDFRNFHPGGKLGAMLRTVGDLMHSGDSLPLVTEDVTMPEALLVMTGKSWGVLGVTGPDGRLVGAISDGDLRRNMNGLLDRRAAEVMTRHPKTISAGALAGEALRLMSEPRPAVTVLFVTEHERAVGIIHIHDLLRAGV